MTLQEGPKLAFHIAGICDLATDIV